MSVPELYTMFTAQKDLISQNTEETTHLLTWRRGMDFKLKL